MVDIRRDTGTSMAIVPVFRCANSCNSVDEHCKTANQRARIRTPDKFTTVALLAMEIYNRCGAALPKLRPVVSRDSHGPVE
jgi:hypothetical protein